MRWREGGFLVGCTNQLAKCFTTSLWAPVCAALADPAGMGGGNYLIVGVFGHEAVHEYINHEQLGY